MLNKNKILLLVFILLLAFFSFLSYEKNTNNDLKSIESEMSSELGSDEILVRGSISCLEYREDNSSGDCIKGIKGDDGILYALDSSKVRFAENNMSVGTEVLASGKFNKANTEISESSVFVYDGVLVLSRIESN